jgi:hypothetical protein
LARFIGNNTHRPPFFSCVCWHGTSKRHLRSFFFAPRIGRIPWPPQEISGFGGEAQACRPGPDSLGITRTRAPSSAPGRGRT